MPAPNAPKTSSVFSPPIFSDLKGEIRQRGAERRLRGTTSHTNLGRSDKSRSFDSKRYTKKKPTMFGGPGSHGSPKTRKTHNTCPKKKTHDIWPPAISRKTPRLLSEHRGHVLLVPLADQGAVRLLGQHLPAARVLVFAQLKKKAPRRGAKRPFQRQSKTRRSAPLL